MRILLYVSLALVALGLVGAMAALSSLPVTRLFLPALVLGGVGAILLWFAVRRGASL